MSAIAKKRGNPNWQANASGNGRGRPKRGLSVAEAVREQVSVEELISFAVSVYQNENVAMRERLIAYKELWDRGYGKSLQTLDLNLGKQEQWIEPLGWGQMSSDDKFAFLDDVRARALRGIIDVADEDSEEVDDDEES